MSDDFMDLLSKPGGTEKDKPQGASQPDLSDLLGGGAGGGLGALLGGLLGGSSGGAGGDMGDMAGLLGGLLGGGQETNSAPAAESGGPLGGLLGGGGGLGGLLGGLLGGGGEPMTFGGGGGPALPFASALAEKLGISTQMANMLITGAIALLAGSAAKKQRSGRSGAVDLNSLADADYIRGSGVASQLSAHMGMSEEEVVAGLQQTMGLMAAQSPAPAVKRGARKTTAKKTSGESSPKRKPAKTTKATPRKKPSKSDTGPDFMDLLDEKP